MVSKSLYGQWVKWVVSVGHFSRKPVAEGFGSIVAFFGLLPFRDACCLFGQIVFPF